MNIGNKTSKEKKNNGKNTKKNLYNYLIKTKDNEKNLTTKFNKNNYTKTNFEPKTVQKEYKNKISHINLKNIIKKIDLISLSLTKKTNKNQKINYRKNLKSKDEITNSIYIKIDLDKFKKEKKYKQLTFLRLNSKNTKDNSSHKNINSTWENLTEHRYQNKNKGKEARIRLLKPLKNDFYKEKYNEFNNNFMTNSNNVRTNGNIKLYKIIKNDIIQLKNKKLYNSDFNINKTKISEKSNRNKKISKFQRNNTESRELNLHLENIINSKRNLDRNNIKILIQKQFKKKKIFFGDKQQLINISNTKKQIKNFDDIIDKVKANKKQLKDHILNREIENNKISKDIIPKKIEIDSNTKTKKSNYKNKIPKPITTYTNTILKMNDINSTNNYNITNGTISYKSYIENKRHFSNDYLDKKLELLIPHSESQNSNSKNNKHNYLINNALINIREYSIPGKTINGQIKLNQDSYIIKRDINNIKNFNIFAVFDGHGFNGHIISEYLKENLIKKIVNHQRLKVLDNLENIYSQFSDNKYKIIKELFYEIDNEILNLNINKDLSGSTCTLLIQIGDKIINANIGDSKAILVYEDDNINNIKNKYKIVKLSKDCTPNIETEKKRIIMNGGKVIQLKNNNEQEKGPLRIFLKDKMIPDLSISRSFGDKIGKSIGVISNPVINEYTLNKTVKFILIASSGIWRFMKEKEIINYGVKYYLLNDPDNFCKSVVNKSMELWKQNVENIDDITILVIFFTFI